MASSSYTDNNKAEGQQSIDDVLACVVGMGFELSDAQLAINNGKITIEEIVEWILQGKPGINKTLDLRAKTAVIGQNPFVPASSSSNVTPVERPPSESTENSGNLHTRVYVNEEQRKAKADFEEKRHLEARKTAQKSRMEEKRAKALILKQINEDRQTIKQRKTVTTSTSPGKETQSSVQITPSSTCTIQIRLPDGRVLRHVFQPDDPFKAVVDYLRLQIDNTDHMILAQPFPRREFSDEDMSSTLQDLKLIPSGSLVLKQKEPNIQIVGDSPVSEPSEDELPVMEYDTSYPGMLHNWGSGTKLESDSINDVASPQQEMDGIEEADDGGIVRRAEPENNVIGERDFVEVDRGRDRGIGIDIPGNIPFPGYLNNNQNQPHQGAGHQVAAGLPNIGGFGVGLPNMALPPHPGNIDQHEEVFHGWGHQMVPEIDDLPHHNVPAHRLAAEAAANRHAVAPPVEEVQSLSFMHQDLPPLLQLCIQYTGRRMTDARTQSPLNGIPEEIANKILEYLIKEKILRPKTLQYFIPCHLRKLILDCYPYATNDLLLALRFHMNMTYLSLCYCPLITDKGLQPLTHLKRIKTLNLSNCKQITDKCFVVIKEFTCLTSLSLEATSVTDAGVIDYACTRPEHLSHLNLNKTTVTHRIFSALAGVASLHSLFLEGTSLESLSEIEHLTSLQVLNIGHTQIPTESLLLLSGLTSLIALNISENVNINGDTGLKYLSSLQLQLLQFPCRTTTTSLGLSHIVGMPLRELDLTNYTNIDDTAMQYIGRLTSLKKLMLGNTRITDVGIRYIKDLLGLEVLCLDRTRIADNCGSVIAGFKALQELSLSSTSVTDVMLQSGFLNTCIMISKLNLSRNTITNTGLSCLSLPHLKLLNMDSTYVTEDACASLKKRNPCLEKIQSNNLQNPANLELL